MAARERTQWPGTALVTGASEGIGLELARLFARDGWGLAPRRLLTAIVRRMQESRARPRPHDSRAGGSAAVPSPRPFR